MKDTYRITDKEEAIRRLQTYLAEVTGVAGVYPSGIYDEQTGEAVRSYRLSRGLGDSSVTDYVTHTRLYSDYENIMKERDAVRLWGARMPLPASVGRVDGDMVYLNRLVAEMMELYGKEHRVTPTRIFSPETARAVSVLRRIYRMSEGSEIDHLLHARMRADADFSASFDRKRR